jgi:hypothetical protein
VLQGFVIDALQGCVIVVLQGCVIVVLQGCVIVALQGCVIVARQCRQLSTAKFCISALYSATLQLCLGNDVYWHYIVPL